MKRLILLLLIMMSLISFTACSNGQASSVNEDSSKNIAQYGAPDRKVDLQGQVKSIRGNEVTVYKVVGGQLELTEEEREKRRQEMQNLSPEERQKAREGWLKVTDETQTFIIPVGIPIISIQNLGGQTEVRNLDLADIQKGALIKIWFKTDSGEGEAEFIQIMNSGGI